MQFPKIVKYEHQKKNPFEKLSGKIVSGITHFYYIEKKCSTNIESTQFSATYIFIRVTLAIKRRISIKKKSILTFGEVAEAKSGSSPPQAMIKLSTSWDIKWTVLTTKMALSLLLTKSNTDLDEWLLQTWMSVSRENNTSDKSRWWM